VSAPPDLRSRLRHATREAHERLHLHRGFAAAAAGRLGASAYRDLLARLYGFHRRFEAGFAEAPAEMADAIELRARARSEALARDLESLGSASHVETLPLCEAVPSLETEPQWLGALYVTEGSTLGGAAIARALAASGFKSDQRHFFEAYGDRRSQMWRSFLARLERHAGDEAAAREAQSAAQSAFDAFETWMRDWRSAPVS
jgi:heme oxygenase